MRRRQSVLYQALTVPPPTYEKIPPNFGWFQPLELPDRERVGAARRVLPIATMVAQESPWPYSQSATDNANARWYRQWVDPPRILKDPDNAVQAASGLTMAALNQPALDNANVRWYRQLAEPTRFAGGWVDQGYLQALLSGESAPPAIQPALDARTTRWFTPLAEPLRFRGGWNDWRYSATLAASGHVAVPPNAFDLFIAANFRYWQPLSEPLRFKRDPRAHIALLASDGEPPYPSDAYDLFLAANFRWFNPLSEPQRFPREPRFSATLSASGSPLWPYAQPDADNATARWHQPFSLPVRFPRDPRWTVTLDASGEPKWAYAQPASDNATTRWFQPLSEPRREYRFVSRITGETPWPAVAGNPTGVFPSNWYAEWRLPQRALRDPRYSAAFAAGEPQWPYNQPASDNANARWFQPLSEPRREYRWIAKIAGEAPWSRIQPNPISMAWWRALEEPRRFLRDPRYSAVLVASGEAPLGQPTASSPLGTTRRALLRSGAFPTFWPGAS